MNELEIIILIGLVVAMATGVGYFLTKGQPTLKEMEEKPKEKFQPRKITQYEGPLTKSVKEIEKIAKVPTTQEESQQLAKDLVDIATTTLKKKKKYYPKKKK